MYGKVQEPLFHVNLGFEAALVVGFKKTFHFDDGLFADHDRATVRETEYHFGFYARAHLVGLINLIAGTDCLPCALFCLPAVHIARCHANFTDCRSRKNHCWHYGKNHQRA